jgi:putative endonuclease
MSLRGSPDFIGTPSNLRKRELSFWRRPESICQSEILLCLYILASKRHGTLYIGVTNELVRRVYEHKPDFVEGFTKKYGVHTLIYYEQCESIESAIQREKQLKAWRRNWKIRLIEEANPDWKDLYYVIA